MCVVNLIARKVLFQFPLHTRFGSYRRGRSLLDLLQLLGGVEDKWVPGGGFF